MVKNLIVGTLVLFLALYSGIIVNFCSLNYLRFFENIAVKIIFLLIIGVVSFFSPLLALFLAIAFLINLEMAHKRQFQKMSNRIENLDFKPTIIEVEDDESEEQMSPQSRRDVNRVNREILKQGQNMVNRLKRKQKRERDQLSRRNNRRKRPGRQDGRDIQEPFISQSNVYDGYSPFASCVNQCQSTDSTNDDLNNECSVVKTWKNQISAQGLQCPNGYSPSMGFPLEE